MSTVMNISNILKGTFFIVIVSLIFSCSKGGEPTPMAANTQSSPSLISSNTTDNSTMRVVGGDDNEDDDDNRGTNFPKRK
ncbi:MAG: hypothetical protein AB7O47_03925 [Flavobacteriales bacterium]